MSSARKDHSGQRAAPPAEQQRAARARQEESAEVLVLLSRIFAWIGFGLLLFGLLTCIAGSSLVSGLVGGLALVVLVVAAILGQVGRGMQGRIM